MRREEDVVSTWVKIRLCIGWVVVFFGIWLIWLFSGRLLMAGHPLLAFAMVAPGYVVILLGVTIGTGEVPDI